MTWAAPDAVLGGRYRLLRRLGSGGMGTVWCAEHLMLGSKVAVKVLTHETARMEGAAQRFFREARAAALLHSPHVVSTIDYGVEGGVPYIVMELLEGETLAQRLDRVGRLPLRETALILTDVARALTRAHGAGIVHRDLKPENIFIVRDDDSELSKVLDFGIAKLDSNAIGIRDATTRSDAIIGTPFYMSPEQMEAKRTVDHRTDLWAFSVIAFECVTGKRPFLNENLGSPVLDVCSRPVPVPSSLAHVPDGFDEWFAKGVARDPERRFQSAREAAQGLRLLCDLPVARARRVAAPLGTNSSTPGAEQDRPRPKALAATAETLGPRAAAELSPEEVTVQRRRRRVDASLRIVVVGMTLALATGFGAWRLTGIGLNQHDTSAPSVLAATPSAIATALGPSPASPSIAPALATIRQPRVEAATSASAPSPPPQPGSIAAPAARTQPRRSNQSPSSRALQPTRPGPEPGSEHLVDLGI